MGPFGSVGGDERASSEWFLLHGSRLAVAGGVLIAAFAALTALYALDAVPVHNSNAMQFLFSALIGGNFTLITVVLSINQLVLSRQLESPDEIREEIDSTIEYRREVEERTDQAVAPVLPSAFLRVLLETTRQRAQAFGGYVRSTGDEELIEDASEIVGTITDSIDRADRLFDEERNDIFSVLSVVLDTNYAEQIRGVKHLEYKYDEQIDDTERAAVDDLVTSLRQVDVARQYFKTIYMQEELARLSRYLLYVGLPAIVALTVVIALFLVPQGPTFPASAAVVLVPLAITVGLGPLAVLFAFVLRITVVAQRTVAVTPFTTPRQEQSEVTGSDDPEAFLTDETAGEEIPTDE